MVLEARRDRPLVWLHGEIKTPPFSKAARIQAGELLRRLQMGQKLAMPVSRPMPQIGTACHELRLRDEGHAWRIVLCIDTGAIVILDVFAKTTRTTPKAVIDRCRDRLARYHSA